MQICERENRKKTGLLDLSSIFSFDLYQLIECHDCRGYKIAKNTYSSLSLMVNSIDGTSMDSLINSFFGKEDIPYRCSRCSCSNAYKYYRFASFPSVLVVQLELFGFVNNVACKKDTIVESAEHLELQTYMIEENDLPTDIIADSCEIDENLLVELLSMGFDESAARNALKSCSNLDTAIAWILENPTVGDGFVLDSSVKTLLLEAGFEEKMVDEALKNTGNDFERSVDWLTSRIEFSHADSHSSSYNLKSFVTHKGKNAACGHYVSHVLLDNNWIMFNDEKVVVDPSPPLKNGYIYFYESKSK